jgi:hypothetical protein
LNSDPANCGACGNICPASTPICQQATCSACQPWETFCAGYGCADLSNDAFNCGACGNQCSGTDVCAGGMCQGQCPDCG